MFFLALVGFVEFFVLLILIEKFTSSTIHRTNYLTFGSAMLGSVIFTFWLFQAPRKELNLSISGGILLASIVMLAGSLTLDKETGDRGPSGLCERVYASNRKSF